MKPLNGLPGLRFRPENRSERERAALKRVPMSGPAKVDKQVGDSSQNRCDGAYIRSLRFWA